MASHSQLPEKGQCVHFSGREGIRYWSNYIPVYIYIGNAIDRRIYYQALSTAYPKDAKALLRDILSLARSELFDHTVKESVLNSAVDYITLGWTRILQVCFDLMSPNEIDAIVPRYESSRILTDDRNFSHQVISTFLFPALPSSDVENPPPMKPYCIHSETRGALFDLVFKLLDTPKRNVISSFVHSILEAGMSFSNSVDFLR